MSETKGADTMTTKQRVGHTPGPWEVMDDTVSHKPTQIVQSGIVIDGERFKVATLNFSTAVKNRNFEEAKANAALIAAAPELLAALRKLHDEYAHQGKGYWVGTGQEVERLIAKAEGRE